MHEGKGFGQSKKHKHARIQEQKVVWKLDMGYNLPIGEGSSF
jgi:hypothetical protein